MSEGCRGRTRARASTRPSGPDSTGRSKSPSRESPSRSTPPSSSRSTRPRPRSSRSTPGGARWGIVPARAGTHADVGAVLARVREAALRGVGTVTAPVSLVAPAITTAAAERAAESARTAVAAPVTIRFRGKELGELGPKRIARLLRFDRHTGRFDLRLDAGGVERLVGPLVRAFTRPPRDASFRVVGTHVRVVKGRDGAALDVSGARAAILAAAVGPGIREARVGLAVVEPKFSTGDARALGIKRQISTYTTDMGLSSANRIHNVHLMADYIDGTIIKPGQIFSFNK